MPDPTCVAAVPAVPNLSFRVLLMILPVSTLSPCNGFIQRAWAITETASNDNVRGDRAGMSISNGTVRWASHPPKHNESSRGEQTADLVA
jgi:hypothetical protein